MENRSRNSRVAPVRLVVCLAGAALLLAAWMGPGAVASAEVAPLIAQADQGACGDRPCGEVPADQGACGAVPCDQIPVEQGACGANPCGEVPADQGPCGGVPCDQVPVDPAGACGGVPCGEATPGDVNNPAAGAQSPEAGAPAGGSTGTTVAGQKGQEGFENGQAAPLDSENTGSSSGSSLVIPLLIVLLAGVVLFWVIFRNRGAAEGDA